MNLPAVRAVLTMVPELEHARWPNRARYMPHIVIGDPAQRKPLLCGNLCTERYLGVFVADAPDELAPGSTAEVALVLMYWPKEHYDEVVPGATFTLREGGKVVGFGNILSSTTWSL